MEQPRTTACIHRWVLGEPTWESVPGVCRRCGAQRNYPSGLEIAEAVTDYQELDRSRPPRALATPSREEERSPV